ncbi:MAG TPA: polyprenol monophosphomannose synthase [Tepidisphaeraceae bacterium]|jgi:dolichol-phosphate mannosyltransferase|nr:polyprenol monophosphomannose synthase [Tepidisphaeraceae bacterium]
MEPAAPEISIIVPALNEAENLRPLAERISAVMAGRSYELLIVDDDSRDDTPATCAELSQSHPLRLITRKSATDGLGGAVLRGIAESQGATLVVMDADLQHPPESIPALLAALDQGADFALGSRYTPGGSTAGRWGFFRKINSSVATLLARPFAGPVRDPMSGFFALRRSTYARATRLAPLGYKIGLELMCKCRVQSVTEVPIHFALRQHGQSKLTLSEQFRYLEHLSRLYDFTFPRLSSSAKFTIVVALGWLVGFALAAALIEIGVHPPAAISTSYAANLAITSLFHMRYVRVQRQFLIIHRPWGAFAATCLAEWITCAAATSWLWHNLKGPRITEIFLLAYLCSLVVRYIFRKELAQDLRGLRYEPRRDELFNQKSC